MSRQTRNRGKYSFTQDGQCRCFDCGDEMYRENLRQHYSAKHPGYEPREKPPKGQEGVFDFMGNVQRRREMEERRRQEELEEERRREQQREEQKRLQDERQRVLDEELRRRQQQEKFLREQEDERRELEEQLLKEELDRKANQESEKKADDAVLSVENAEKETDHSNRHHNSPQEQQSQSIDIYEGGNDKDLQDCSHTRAQGSSRMEVDKNDWEMQKDLEDFAKNLGGDSQQNQSYRGTDQDHGGIVLDNTSNDSLEVRHDEESPHSAKESNCKKRRMSASPPYDSFQNDVLERLKQIESNTATSGLSDVIENLRRDVQNLSFQTMPPEMRRREKLALTNSREAAYDVIAMDAAKNAKTIKEFVARLPNVHYHYGTAADKLANIPDGIFCEDCAVEVGPRAYGSFPGVMKYSFPDQSKWPDPKKPPKEYRNLRDHTETHMKSKLHYKNVAEKIKMQAKMSERQRKSENEKAGMTCGMYAYKSIVQNHSFSSYEMDITTAANTGAFVGQKNHSRAFPAEMLDHFYESLREQWHDQITEPLPGTNRPPPLSIIMDKHTANKRTYNVVGLNTYSGGKLKTFYSDAYPVEDHSGKGIANSVYESNSKVLDNNWAKRYVGTCADGGMLRLGYMKYLDCLARHSTPPRGSHAPQEEIIQEDLGECTAGRSHSEKENQKLSKEEKEWYSHVWDAAHLVELANKDAKKDGDNPWVAEAVEAVSALNQKILYGKMREEAINIAKKNNDRFYAPKTFSATRWVNYGSEACDSTLENYPTLYDLLAKHEDPLVETITQPEFVLQATVFSDICAEKGKLSRSLQVPDMYAWNVQRTVEQACQNLETMREALVNPENGIEHLQKLASPNGGYKLLERFGYAAYELEHHGTYQERALNIDDRSLSDIINDTKSKAAAYLESDLKALKNRFTDEKNTILEPASELFDLERILNRNIDEIPDTSLNKYATAAMKVEYMEPRTPMTSIRRQYEEFQKTAHRVAKENYNAAANSSNRRQIEKRLYEDLLSGHHGAENFPEVNHLAASATLRLYNESQVESMASQMKKLTENRPLDPETVSKEAFLTRNGPPPNAYCKPLVADALNRKYKGGAENGILWMFVADLRSLSLK